MIPKWIKAMIHNDPVYINGDGETSRDICYIDNAVQANLLSAAKIGGRQANKTNPAEFIYGT